MTLNAQRSTLNLICALATVANAFAGTDAYAWDYTTVLVPDDFGYGVGTAIRNWGPADHVVIAINREDEGGADDINFMEIRSFSCSNNDDCATASLVGVETTGTQLRFGASFLPSLAIDKAGPTEPIVVRMVARTKIEQDCNGDTEEYLELDDNEGNDPDALSRDLKEYVFESDNTNGPTLVDDFDVDVAPGGTLCRDHRVSSTAIYEGGTWSCWTVTPNTAGGAWVACGTRLNPPGYWQTLEAIVEATDTTENPWLDFRNGNRVVAMHNADTTSVGLYHLDQPGDPHVEFSALADDTPWPTLYVRANGRMHLAWSDVDNSSGVTTFQFSGCLASADCDDIGDWHAFHTSFPSATQHEIDAADGLALHPQLAVDGDKQFLLGMADPAGNGQNYGVYLYERCGNGAWSGPELVKARLSIGNDQSIANGVPNIVLNKPEQTVHVVFVETTGTYESPSDGTVFWARRGYDACP